MIDVRFKCGMGVKRMKNSFVRHVAGVKGLSNLGTGHWEGLELNVKIVTGLPLSLGNMMHSRLPGEV